MKNLLKYASLLLAAAMLFSCGEKDDIAEKKLIIKTDKNFIQTFGGDYATISVFFEGEDVTAESQLLDGDNKPVVLQDFRFSQTKAGDYKFRALWGTYASEVITIKAISETVPATLTDPRPASTSFKAKVLANEFTTSGCTACPSLKQFLHDALEQPGMAEKVLLTECHSGLFNGKGDPAYIETSYDAFSGKTGFPFLHLDMYFGITPRTNYTTDTYVGFLNTVYEKKLDVATGISVNSTLVGNKMIAKVTIKAAESGPHYVGAILLEDKVYADQSGLGSGQGWMKERDNVIRYIDGMGESGGKEHYFGHLAGDIEKGETADYVFVWDLDEIWEKGNSNCTINGGSNWEPFVMDNLHFAVYTCTEDADGKYFSSNVVDCELEGELKFQYK